MLVGLDIETTDLAPERGKVRLMQLADERGRVYVLDAFTADIQQVVDALEHRPNLVAHNAVFEESFLRYHYGFNPDKPLHDTQLAYLVLKQGAIQRDVYSIPHSLEDVVRDVLGEELDRCTR